MSTRHVEFYEKIDRETIYTAIEQPIQHAHFSKLLQFIEDYELKNKKCLEVGSSKGIFQDIVSDYSGLDIAESLRKYYHKPFYTVQDNEYPFEDESFDAIWTIHTFEHIYDIEEHLIEMVRILRPSGVIFFFPAWYCSPYAANGYRVRLYTDFGFCGKLIKFLLPFLDGKFVRYLSFIPKRAINYFVYYIRKQPKRFVVKRITPNYEKYWQADSDACNSLDPFNIIIFLKQFNMECISHPSIIQQMFVKGGPILFIKKQTK